MRIRTLVLLSVASAVSSPLAMIACSQGAPSTQSPDATQTTSSSPLSTATPAQSGAVTAAPVAADEFSACKSAVAKGGSAEIANPPPDAGVAMNNAQTSGDAGGSDRLSKIIEVVMQNRDKFRCCFDIWGQKNPGKESKVALSLDLKPSGEIRTATFKADETDLKDPTVERCMSAVASSLTYPESPSAKDTTYIHRFVFRSHH